MDTKKIRNTLTWVGTLIAVGVLTFELMPELFGIAWHWRHGRTAHIGMYDVNPPMFWITTSNEGNWEVHSIKRPPIRSAFGQWATMSLSAEPMYSTATEMRQSAATLDDRPGMRTTESAHFSVAGQEISCFDKRQVSGTITQSAEKAKAVEIICVPENDKRAFSASFVGSPSLLPVFYDTVKSVRRR